MAKNAPKHDKMVEYVARKLKQRFYDDVRAHAEGFHPPSKVEISQEQPALVPDVTMVARGGELHVLEVETAETLKHPDTAKKWQVLAHHAAQRGGRFWVVVPQGVSAHAVSKLRSVDVQAKVWEVQPEYA